VHLWQFRVANLIHAGTEIAGKIAGKPKQKRARPNAMPGSNAYFRNPSRPMIC
jgi:hypothetical protein